MSTTPDPFRARSDAYAAGEELAGAEESTERNASLEPFAFDHQVETLLATVVALEGENARLVEVLAALAGDACVCPPPPGGRGGWLAHRRGGPACPRHTPARLARELLDELGISYNGSETS